MNRYRRVFATGFRRVHSGTAGSTRYHLTRVAREEHKSISDQEGTYWSTFPELTFRLFDAQGQPLSGRELADAGRAMDSKVDLLTSGNGLLTDAFFSEIKPQSCGMLNAIGAMTHFFGAPYGVDHTKRAEPFVTQVQNSLNGESNPNNQWHMRAVCSFYEGDLIDACISWENALLGNPLDLLAVRCAVETYLLLGDRKNALGVVERVLSCWEVFTPGYSRLVAMHGHALLENGYFPEGEECVGRSLTLSEDNILAIWAGAIGFYSTSRHREGKRLLVETKDYFAEEYDGSPVSYLSGDLVMMQAIFDIEPGKFWNTLFLLDEHLAPSGEANFGCCANVLWRCILSGLNDEVLIHESRQIYQKQKGFSSWFSNSESKGDDSFDPRSVRTITDRLKDLSSYVHAFDARVTRMMHHVLSVFVLTGAGESERVRAYLAAMEAAYCAPRLQFEDSEAGINYFGSKERLSARLKTTTLICQAIVELFEGRSSNAVKSLLATRPQWSLVAGSVLDQDLLEQTLIYAALDAAGVPTSLMTDIRLVALGKESVVSTHHQRDIGQEGEQKDQDKLHMWIARGLINERSCRLPNSPRTWEWYSRLQGCLGNADASEKAAMRALDLGFRQGGQDAN